MKTATKARIARYALMICVALFLAVPAVSTVSQIGSGAEIREGIPAVYDLDGMCEEDLQTNINIATEGREGCTLSYGDVNVPVTGADIGKIASAAKASGEKEARVLTADGTTAFQSGIVMSDNVVQRQIAGIAVPGMASSLSELVFEYSIRSGDAEFRSDSSSYTKGDAVCVEITVPFVVLAVSQALGSEVDGTVGLKYGKMVEFSIKALAGESSPAEYDVEVVDGVSTLTVYGCGIPDRCSGSVGGVDMRFSDGNLALSCEGKISEKLSSRMDGGRLTIEAGGDSYTMSGGNSAAFVEFVRILEGSA